MVDSDGMMMNHLSINSTGHQHQAGLIPTGYHANGQLAEAHMARMPVCWVVGLLDESNVWTSRGSVLEQCGR
jgi:hypothetical protein